MISKYFIDRPIFATVLSVVILLTGVIARQFLPLAQYPRIVPPLVNVSITYPGASAQVIAETVAAPIEQRVNGVPGMLYMSSQMGNDGSYQLSVTFDVDVDLNTALVTVQNRVTEAMPQLPTPVQNQGITIRKKTPDQLLMINFISANDYVLKDGTTFRGVVRTDHGDALTLRDATGKQIKVERTEIESISAPLFSDVELSNFALINIRDEILRVDGVADVSIMGQRDYSIRAWLDPQKMASRQITATDVSTAVRTQNLQAAGGQVGAPPTRSAQVFQLPIHTLGRLSTPEEFGNIIVKVGSNQPKTVAARGAAKSPSGADTNSELVDPNSLLPSTSNPGVLSGGATTGGGANAGGGGTTGGGATSDADPTTIGEMVPAKKISAVNKLLRGATTITGPVPPSIPIVRLKDIARVELGALNYNMACTFDGGPAVGLSCYQIPTSNALDVADRVRARMRELKKRFPEGLDYTIAYDTTPFIRESISEVYTTLRDAVILVAIVVLFFLQDWRAMILPMIDVPVALIGTFAVMTLFGYSLNNISMFGLVLSIGIVVDDAIVVLENIERQMAKGYDVRTATIKAMEEISGPIIAITLVLCAVFIPCAFVSGITGRFFRQFAVTIAASTIISAINALTMTPSRALIIFKNRERKTLGAHHEREALPWWIFGLLGMVTVSWLPHLLEGPLGLPPMTPEEDDDVPLPGLELCGLYLLYFTPGMLAGLGIGWCVIKPVNRVLGGVFRGFNYGFDKLTDVYGWTIGKGLRLSAIVLIAYAGLLIFTYALFRDSPRGFVPAQDTGRLLCSIQLPDSAGLARSQEVVQQVDKIIRFVKDKDGHLQPRPGVTHTIGLAGTSFAEQANGSNFASFFIILDRFERRGDPSMRANAIMKDLRAQFANEVKDARATIMSSSAVPGVSSSGGFRVMVQDRGGLGLATLQAQTDKLVQAARRQIGEQAGQQKKPTSGDDDDDAIEMRPMLAGLNTQFRSSTPQLYMDIDKVKAESLDVSYDEVNQTLQVFLGSLNVNRFNAYGRYWQVTLQADREFRSHVEDINLLQVRNRRGQMVPLGTLVNVREMTGPLFVKRYNLYTAAPIGGAIMPGVSSGEVINAMDYIADETLPRSMKAEWTELMYMQVRERNTTGLVFGLAVMCVFLALAALYESWLLPLAVILVVPLCVLSSITGVLVRKNLLGHDASVDIFVQIGLVVLVGLACKNAILVVEFAKELHENGKSVWDATLEASRLRLRPILMTSFAFILGVMPLCVASGAGSEMRRSLGVAVFSGMLGVTMFGIFVTPIFFYVIQGLGETRLFSAPIIQWAVSLVVADLVGGTTGYFLNRLGFMPMITRAWMIVICVMIGMLAVLAVRGLHRTIASRRK